MNVHEYCENVVVELENWQEKLNHVDQQIAALPCGAKEKMLGNIEELHMTIAEIEDRISSLRNSCPTSWRPDRDESAGPVSFNYEEALKSKVDYDFGG